MIISEVLSIGPSSADSSELDVLESLQLSAILKNGQCDTADLVKRHHKNQPMGGGP